MLLLTLEEYVGFSQILDWGLQCNFAYDSIYRIKTVGNYPRFK